MLQRTLLFLTAFYLSFAMPATAESDPVTAKMVLEQQSIRPGKSFWAGIHLKLDEQWHAYWKNPGDAGMAPTVEWELPEGFKAGPLLWPTPQKFSLNAMTGFGYEGELFLLAELTAPLKLPEEVTIGADVRWVVCNDESCLPGKEKVSVTIPVSKSAPNPEQGHQEVFSRARERLPQRNYSVVAERKDGLISLKLNSSHQITGAKFFPEDSSKIDHSADPILTRSKENAETYHMIVREAENADPKDPVRGVIVLHTENEGDKSYEINLPVTEFNGEELALNDELVSSPDLYGTGTHDFKGGFALALLLAFAGGLILNLMPCVLPVVSFKVLSFVKMAGQSRSLIFKHGVAFSLGVLLSFWALASVLLVLQAYGRTVGWGFQLQEPIFVALLTAIIFVFGLSLFGVFELGIGVASLAGQAQTSKNSGISASFFSGILATAVATPCTGPFLGTAVGFAVTLPPALAMLIFTSLGLGMASPYLLLGAFPGLLRFMPKPGNWMIIFKEAMGFVMMATVLWLLWVFGAQTGSLAVTVLLAGFFLMSIGCWIFGKWGTPFQSKVTRRISYVSTFVFFFLGSYLLYFASSSESMVSENTHTAEASEWEPFSVLRVAELRQQGVPVFIDFTAKWCLICQANHMVLSTKDLDKKFQELGVVRMKADWTKNDPEITAELKKFGRNSVPLYLFYSAASEAPPKILPQVLTPDIVMAELEEKRQ